MEEEMKPCPFCGKEATMDRVLGIACGHKWWWVRCSDIRCIRQPIQYETRKAAVAAWNRRTP